MSQQSTIETIDQIINHAKNRGVIHLSTEDSILHNNEITINEQKLVNFGSCSYLGLEFHPKLRNAAKNAIDAYGTQFSSSRAYISPKYYVELEEKLEKLFGSPTIVAATTTLGHLAALPVLVGSNDAVILDHQVHSSIQSASQQLKAKKIHVELVRHNRMDLLEERIIELKANHNKVWYFADGIYSMFGDTVPIDKIYALLDKYPEFNFYVDDAHAMSCFGENGKGFVLSGRKIHERMIVATSFAKAFATGGGALIFPNRALAQKVRNCGGTLITSGPMQPSALGAAIASADIHLSPEIEELKEDLQENIKYTTLLLKKYGLPNLSEATSPIFFIAVGLPKIGYTLIERLMKDGHFLNLGIFPAVPIKNTGVRFTITRMHTFEQIEAMVKSMASHYSNVLKECDFTLDQVYKAFRLETPVSNVTNDSKQENLVVTRYKSINEIDTEIWDELMDERGAFDHEFLRTLENSFAENESIEDNWEFDYYIIKDAQGKIILSTFTTTSILKDDMLMPHYISKEVENKRKKDSFYLTSKTLTVGSSLSEGDHLYINRDSEDWKTALILFLNELEQLQNEYKAENIIIRDLIDSDPELDSFMVDNGFFKMAMPESGVIENMTFESDEEFYQNLSKRSKRHFKENVKRFEDRFSVQIIQTPSEKQLSEYYSLYLNVKGNSLELNTFTLPYKLFSEMSKCQNWEFIELSLKADKNAKPIGVVFAYKTKKLYNALIVGLDYELNLEFNTYRQAIYQVIKRSRAHSTKSLSLGFSAIIEKKKFGATIKNTCAYLQTKDNYNMELLNTITETKNMLCGDNERRILPI